MRQLALICLFLIASLALAQATETDTEPETKPAPPILPFRTYHQKWLRYTNQADGQPLLAIDDITTFAYRFVNSATALRPADFDDADLLASLLEAAAYPEDDDEIAGKCQTDKLPGDLPDLFCTPGTAAMPHGHIILALYHPETNEIAALTTSIDNKAGGATHADWSPTPVPVAEADGCGPFVPGQWIKAKDYEASGLDLPTRGQRNGATDYQCMVENGAAYMQAYPLPGGGGQSASENGAGGQSASENEAGGQGGGGNGNGGNGNGGAPSGGDGGDRIDYRTPKNPPCTHPLGCDFGDVEE